MSSFYSNRELRFFRLAKCVVDHSTAALRKVFEQEWNYLYPSCPWQNNTTSGSKLLAEERPSSRLYDPAYSADYQHIKDSLSRGNVEEWDVTALVFALRYSHALNRIRYGYHWRRIGNAMYQIKEVRNTLFSHACKAALSRSTFERNMDILVQAVGDLLSSSDPLVDKLRKLQSRTQSLQAFWSAGQRRKDSGDIEFYYRRISAVKQWKPFRNSQSKKLNFFDVPRVFPALPR